MALSGEGQLLALLDGLDDWRAGRCTSHYVMSFRNGAKQRATADAIALLSNRVLTGW